MNYNEWLNCYTKLTSKLNKKSALTDDEITLLLDIIEKVQKFIDNAQYEVLKRQ